MVTCMRSFHYAHSLRRVDDGGAVLRRNLSTAFMRGLGRASAMPLRAARSVSRKRHRPELPFMPGRGADIGPGNEASLLPAEHGRSSPSRRGVVSLAISLDNAGAACLTSIPWAACRWTLTGGKARLLRGPSQELLSPRRSRAQV